MSIFFQDTQKELGPVNRFLFNTVNQFIPRHYTAEQVIAKLEIEIRLLEEWIMRNEPDTKIFREKSQLLKDKKAELESFKTEAV